MRYIANTIIVVLLHVPLASAQVNHLQTASAARAGPKGPPYSATSLRERRCGPFDAQQNKSECEMVCGSDREVGTENERSKICPLTYAVNGLKRSFSSFPPTLRDSTIVAGQRWFRESRSKRRIPEDRNGEAIVVRLERRWRRLSSLLLMFPAVGQKLKTISAIARCLQRREMY